MAARDRAFPAGRRARPPLHAGARGARRRLRVPGLLHPHEAEPGVQRRAPIREAGSGTGRHLAMAHVELALIKFGGDWDWEGAEEVIPTRAPARTRERHGARVLRLAADAARPRGRRDCPGQGRATSSPRVAVRRAAAARRPCTWPAATRGDRALRRVSAAIPTTSSPLALRGQCYELTGMFPEAVTDLERPPRLPIARRSMSACWVTATAGGHACGSPGIWSRSYDSRVARSTCRPSATSYVYAGLGEKRRRSSTRTRRTRTGPRRSTTWPRVFASLYALDPQQKQRLEQMRLIV